METLTIDIDERLIREHGKEVDHTCGCPAFFWLEEHGFAPTYVGYEYAALEDGRILGFPQEFVWWQQDAVLVMKDEGVDPRTVLRPITFTAVLE